MSKATLMAWLVVGALSVAAALLSWWRAKRKHPLSQLPGPPQLPLLGSLPWFEVGAPHNTFSGFARYGELVHFTILRDEFLIVYRPEHIKQVLVEKRAHYGKGPGYKKGMGQYLGNSILVADHEDWKPQRALLQPLFTPKAMDHHIETIAARSEVLLDHLDALLGERDSLELAMAQELRKVILDFIGAVGFGHDFGALQDVGIRESRIVSAMDACLEYSERAGFGIPPVLYPSLTRRFETEREWIRAQIREVLRGEGHDERTLLGRMQAAASEPANAWLSEEMMIDESFTFLFAGSDTTAHSIACLLQMLCEHPQVYARLQAEVDAAFAGALPRSYRALEAVCPYLSMVNNETLRLYPSAPAVGRYTEVATSIGEQPVPPGVNVIVAPFATHRDPRFWTQPELFDPERFAAGERAAQGEGARTFFPFVYGPRNCIGLYLSKLYTFVLVPLLLRRFRVALPQGTPKLSVEHLRTRTSLSVTTGLPMVLSRR